VGTEDLRLFFPIIVARVEGTCDVKYEERNKVLIDEVLIRGAAVISELGVSLFALFALMVHFFREPTHGPRNKFADCWDLFFYCSS
jgi:hypothetical protein